MQFETTWLGSESESTLASRRWIWEGYVALKQITLFTAMWKSGKTTLLAHLLAQRKQGGALIGQAVAQGKSLVVSEEAREFWGDRHRRLGFGTEDAFLCRPFRRVPTMEDWLGLVEHLLEWRRTREGDLVILDPIATLMPSLDGGIAAQVVATLEPLHRLTDAGMAVLLIHHPRRARSAAGATARGSGALQSFVDILLEMYRTAPASEDDRRRRLLGFSREPATPRSRLIELNAEGTAYACVEEKPDDDFLKTWDMLHIALLDAGPAVSRAELLAQWPESFPPPNPKTLWRWLDQAFERGLVRREGTGSRTEPHRYLLPDRVESANEKS